MIGEGRPPRAGHVHSAAGDELCSFLRPRGLQGLLVELQARAKLPRTEVAEGADRVSDDLASPADTAPVVMNSAISHLS